MILTPHRAAFSTRGKRMHTPMGKDAPWDAQLRVSRYPRFVQANTGTGCAKNATRALPSGVMTASNAYRRPIRPEPRGARGCGRDAKPSPAASPRRVFPRLMPARRAARRLLVPRVTGSARRVLRWRVLWRPWWARGSWSGLLALVAPAAGAWIPSTRCATARQGTANAMCTRQRPRECSRCPRTRPKRACAS